MAEDQGLAMGFSPEAIATRQAQGGGPGVGGPFGDMSEEERAAMRATAQAGGGVGGLGPGGNMSAEEREALRATAEAGGMSGPGNRPFAGRGAGGVRQTAFLIEPVVELLTERASE